MMELAPPFRIATAEDAAVLAELVNYAGEGLPEYLWSKMAEPGCDAWETGRQRQARKAEEGQIAVVDLGHGPIAGLTGYAIPSRIEPIPDDLPAIFKPLQELENLAPSTWYVNVLATLPDHRGKGYGSKLLELAEQISGNEGLDSMSLIVADNNPNARRLYERHGYMQKASRTLVKEDWKTDAKNWILMIKKLND